MAMFTVEYSEGIREIIGFFNGYEDLEEKLPRLFEADSLKSASEKALSFVKEAAGYDLEGQFFIVTGEDGNSYRREFRYNRTFDVLSAKDNLNYKGYSFSVSAMDVPEEAFADYGYVPDPIEFLWFTYDEIEDLESIAIDPFMEDSEIAEALDSYLFENLGSMEGEYTIRYSNGIRMLSEGLGKDLKNSVTEECMEEVQRRILDDFGPIWEYDLKGQWFSISDGMRTYKHRFNRCNLYEELCDDEINSDSVGFAKMASLDDEERKALHHLEECGYIIYCSDEDSCDIWEAVSPYMPEKMICDIVEDVVEPGTYNAAVISRYRRTGN